MDDARLREVWRVWRECYQRSALIDERVAAKDVLEIIRALIEERATNACLVDPLLDPEVALKRVLEEVGIKKKQWITT